MAIKLLFNEITQNGDISTIRESNIYDSDKLVLPRVGDVITFQFSGKGELVVTKIKYEYSIYSSKCVPEKIIIYLKTPQKDDNQST
jgi:hypothetical protein